MRPAGGFRQLWASLRHPWIAPTVLLYIAGLVALVFLHRGAALRALLVNLLIAALGLGITAWVTRREGSRPGPAPHPWVGVLLALGLSIFQIVRPDFVPLPLPSGPVREVLSALLWQVALPAAILLLCGVPWTYLGLSSLARGWSRWRRLLVILGGVLTLPALLHGGGLVLLVEEPAQNFFLALPLAYLYAGLGRAVPQEFLFRQVLQPRMQALFQRPTAAIVGQALLFGLAGAGRRIALGEPWPLALLTATLQGGALGFLYGLLRDRTGSLALPILVHTWVATWEVLPGVVAVIWR